MSYTGKLPDDWSRVTVARSLANRAARLLKLVELDAPAILIESELMLVEQAVKSFPSDPEQRREVVRIEDAVMRNGHD